MKMDDKHTQTNEAHSACCVNHQDCVDAIQYDLMN